ncbi:acyl-CoA dehydrogenase family protein [Novosphingobium malaysiense]|uniref:acyl-CoA dehydrogenase family protein n=1 Tax=Novosphingobium malaysiense TaxID=1348853 RepID=UPI00069051AF|nr:acyl-CoA dehydrogenase family protein [Novosphingobium malaysiense]
MNDEQRMLADMAGDLFTNLGPDAAMKDHWSAIEEVALTGLLLPEDKGGFGGSWGDALIAFRLAGYHALGLPVVEAVVAAALTQRPEGRGTIASRTEGTVSGVTFTGRISGACLASGADYIVAPCPEGGSMVLSVADAKVEAHENLAGEARDGLVCTGTSVERIEADVFAFGALARVAQIAGALDAALEKAVNYANERQQFGRPLAKFQAVQQNLATFACEAAAANCAAMGAAQAMSRGEAPFEIAAAKLRANRAVGIGTALAHQVHGAIGFTEEYPLHPLTRRLWAWRSEFGNDSVWAEKLGQTIVARGAENFWADLTALTG